MLKAVKKATWRLEWGVMVGLCQPEGEEVRCGEGASWFQRAGGMVLLGWGEVQARGVPEGFRQNSDRIRSGSLRDHPQQTDSPSISKPISWVTCPPHPYPLPPLAKEGQDQ